jgi:hypothetical protein
MALRTDPYGNIFCSDCDGRLDTQWSLGAYLATFLLADIVTWILTALFVGLGLLWEPAYLIAGAIAVFGVYRATTNQRHYICTSCKRQFTFKEVHGH